MKKLPQKLFVYWDEPSNDEPCLLCTTDADSAASIGGKIRIGTYELKQQQDAELVLKLSPVRKGK